VSSVVVARSVGVSLVASAGTLQLTASQTHDTATVITVVTACVTPDPEPYTNLSQFPVNLCW